MKVLAIYGSPRKGGTTDTLLNIFLNRLGSLSPHPSTVRVFLRDMKISPCIECYGCVKNRGRCVVNDDMQDIYRYIEESDVIVLSAPIFFYSFNALTKAMIDRIQAMWVRKYMLKEPVPGKRLGILISAGGTRGEKLFEGAILTYRYFLDSFNGKFLCDLTFRGLDDPGRIEEVRKEVDIKMKKALEMLSSSA